MTCDPSRFSAKSFSLSVMTLLGLSIFSAEIHAQAVAQNANTIQPVTIAKLGTTKNVHVCGNLYTAGQFTKEDINEIRKAGIERVITLRKPSEVSWDEKKLVESAGMKFQSIPFYLPNSLTDEIFNDVRKQLADKKTKTLLHCGAASRVAAVWLPYRVLDEGQDQEVAIKEARKIGKLPKVYLDRAISYIARIKKNQGNSLQTKAQKNKTKQKRKY